MILIITCMLCDLTFGILMGMALFLLLNIALVISCHLTFLISFSNICPRLNKNVLGVLIDDCSESVNCIV